MEFKTVNDILDFAIKGEEEAYNFYNDLASKMTREAMIAIFKEFAMEEFSHRQKLLEVKSGNLLLSDESKIVDLKIADYIDSNVKISKDMDYQDALIFAMSKEKKAFKMYMDLASKTDNPEVKKLLLGIAQEEAKHKLRFELEYDQMVLTDN